jgi:hypothetical protein
MREDAITTTQFFRESDDSNLVEKNEKHRVWLNLNNGETPVNQILVGYMQGASENVDDKIDGQTLVTSNTMLYNLINNKEYVIQGKSLPFSNEDVVKLGLKVVEAGNFEINIEQVDGLFTNQDVFIKDNYSNVIHNLKETSYNFIAQAGTFNDRFELIYKKSIKEETINTNTVDVLVKNSDLTIQSYQTVISSVEVFDILGKVIFSKNGINNKQFNTNQIATSNQALIVKIQLENGKVIVKKIII